MGLKKRLKKKLGKRMDTLKVITGKDTSGEKKYKDKLEQAEGTIAGLQPEDPNVELERRMESYRTANDRARSAAEADARRAGTYADTEAFRTSLTGEASARARGIQSEELNRINALRRQLGMPEAAPGTI